MSEQFYWDFVSCDEVHALHANAIATYGGLDGGTVPGCVEQCVDGAKTAAGYAADGDEPDLLAATAYLLKYIAKNHCFSDGSKRTAWMALVRALGLNGIYVSATVEDAIRLVEDVVVGRADADDIVVWLASPGRLVAHDPLMPLPPSLVATQDELK